jgi:hypothetical protein
MDVTMLLLSRTSTENVDRQPERETECDRLWAIFFTHHDFIVNESPLDGIQDNVIVYRKTQVKSERTVSGHQGIFEKENVTAPPVNS